MLKNESEQIRSEFLEYAKFFPSLLFIIYALGFLVININLSRYGIFEFDLLQTRFISSGIIFSIFSIYLFLFLEIFFRSVFLKRKFAQGSFLKKIFRVRFIIHLFTFSLALAVFPLLILDKIPQWAGGMRATPASIIGNSDQLMFLNNFDIGLEENAAGKESVQTKPVCLLYQNQDHALIGVLQWIEEKKARAVRVLYLDKNKILGFQLRGGTVAHIDCTDVKFSNL